MKKALLACFAMIVPALCGCDFDDSEDAYQYSTPDFFLSRIEGTHPYYTIRSTEVDRSFPDYGTAVALEINKSCAFSPLEKFAPTTERHMTYHLLFSLSTAGPNYSSFSIYADGSAVIEYKKALGKLHSYYYACEPSQGLHINEFVEVYLKQQIIDEAEAKKQGESGATMENFFDYARSFNFASVSWELDGSRANGVGTFADQWWSFLEEIEKTAFKPIDDPSVPDAACLTYAHSNYYQIARPTWVFEMLRGCEYARIKYFYEYKGVEYDARRYYSLSQADGKRILNRAASISKNGW